MNRRTPSRRTETLALPFLLAAFLLAPPAARAQTAGTPPPEVTIEAKAEGFYRPTLRYLYPPPDSLPRPLPAALKSFDDRLRFALGWSGYVRLVLPGDSLFVGPREIGGSGGPATELRLAYLLEQGKVRAVLHLAEPGEEPFWSGTLLFDAESAVRSADGSAEEVLRRLTGMTPPFRSRIVCVQKQPGNVKELVLVAYDGDRRWPLTRDGSIALSPSWAPDGHKIVFSSFRGGGDADLYIADLEARRIRKLLTREGTDAAPAWSPDGRWIVFAGSRGARTDLYLVHPDGSGLRNLTNSPSIETSPSWSPTGRDIVFMSDRSGSPQIYRMDEEGANLLRLTYDGSYNADPAWSPAGDRIAYVRLEAKGFQVRIMNPLGDYDIPLTDEPGDHLEPSWSPDGMKISYGYRGRIWVMNADGTDRRPLLAEGLMPDWSPLPE